MENRGNFGCPDTFNSMVRHFHDDMLARVLDNGNSSEAFPVTNGLKQGCVATSTLLSRMLTVNLLADFFCNVEESDGGILITRYRTDERLFTWVGYRQ